MIAPPPATSSPRCEAQSGCFLRNKTIVPEDNVLKVNVPQDNSAINPEHCSVILSKHPSWFWVARSGRCSCDSRHSCWIQTSPSRRYSLSLEGRTADRGTLCQSSTLQHQVPAVPEPTSCEAFLAWRNPDPRPFNYGRMMIVGGTGAREQSVPRSFSLCSDCSAARRS